MFQVLFFEEETTRPMVALLARAALNSCSLSALRLFCPLALSLTLSLSLSLSLSLCVSAIWLKLFAVIRVCDSLCIGRSICSPIQHHL